MPPQSLNRSSDESCRGTPVGTKASIDSVRPLVDEEEVVCAEIENHQDLRPVEGEMARPHEPGEVGSGRHRR